MIPSSSAVDMSNPFCSRHVRPNAVEYLFDEDTNATCLLNRLQAAGWRGEIVGPHGSGKSALLAALIPEIRRTGCVPVLVELHNGQKRLPIKHESLFDTDISQNNNVKKILIIDGYEQLGRWSKFRLKRFCRRHSIGLLVTSHRSVGFPEIYRTQPTIELATKIVERLLDNYDGENISSTAIRFAFERHNGDIREMLFDLYDIYERQQGCRPVSASAPLKKSTPDGH